ncbi:virulence protein SciE type [Rhodobacteraceae bacterium 2376]|uniref:Virulence protein SciE type n=1 Tax=Rhabdonatronobacter sediminivivens TaxID=2743469 RepID=A0A7Z0I0E9_9RHOB|nr:type VI secretion system accessory protein TagJ [Rhabdonatronobacter sediminivivens]NYS25633.1 virulence protein SciE type [Rhabdonatronobacter sediminivivens]
MDATEHLKANDLDGALGALQAEVRKNPGDAKRRIFLFQLLCVLGDWKRAITQLKLCAELDPLATPMAQAYREAIVCEVQRARVFAGEEAPMVLGDPQQWLALLIQAQGHLARGEVAQADDLRGQAFEAAPASPGALDGTRFDWIADADMRLGPVLEAVINGRYFWVPFSAIRSITLEPPEDLRDSVWMPAQLQLISEGELVALIPTRYPGTIEGGTDAEKLARATSWHEAGEGLYTGRGQRILSTDAAEVALMDLRHIALDPVPAEAG